MEGDGFSGFGEDGGGSLPGPPAAPDPVLRLFAQVPLPITLLILLPPVGLSTYWCATYSGLYRALVELQVHHGVYSAKLAWLVVFGVCLLPAVILLHLIAASRMSAVDPHDALARTEPYTDRIARARTWVNGNPVVFVGVLITILTEAMGVYETVRAQLTGDRVAVDMSSIERGDGPRARYVEVTGRLLGEKAISYQERRANRPDPWPMLYIPLVSQDWRPGQPIRMYLELSEQWFKQYSADLATGRYSGTLTANGLSGAILAIMAMRGRPIADTYWVLLYRHSPAMEGVAGHYMLVMGTVTGLLTQLIFLITARRGRRPGRRAA